MLFNSFDYLLFLPLVLVAFHLMPKRHRWIMLLGVSYYFYMSWKPFFAVFMLLSTAVDYWSGLGMQASSTARERKAYMFASLAVNLGMLGFFKYFNFFAHNGEVLLGRFGIFYDTPVLDIILPVGISFYTFQSLSYTLDVYKGKEKAETHFGYFALYVSYFPQLVAGPIERAGRLIPQLRDTPPLTSEDVRYGINKILLGYFKKVVIADQLALFVDQMYAHVPSGTGLQYYVATAFFTIQLFADFSGYTDIAMGSARLMGVRLMDNFDRPIMQPSLSKFWSRWHISLTSWIRDYIFVPLVMANKQWAWLYTIFTFTLIGFWHGASWTFVIFGLCNGVFMVLQNLYTKIPAFRSFNASRTGRIIWGFWNFNVLALFAVFFRSTEPAHAFAILRHIFTDLRIGPGELRSAFQAEMYIGFLMLAFAAITVLFNRQLRFRYNWIYITCMLGAIFLFGSDAANQFIYFQF